MAIYSLFTYSIFVNAVRERTESNLRDANSALIQSIRDEFDDSGESGVADSTLKDSLEEFRFRDYRFLILSRSGSVIASTEEKLDPSILQAAQKNGYQRIEIDELPILVFSEPANVGLKDLQFVVYRSIADDMRLEKTIERALQIAFAVLILTASLGGYLLARKSLSPIEEMAAQAQSITSSDLSRRLSAATIDDELGRLARVINDLLERLNIEFSRQKRFLSDASHELRTPVAIIRGEADVALQDEQRNAAELRLALKVISDVSNELTAIIDDLFLISRADSGEIKPHFAEIDLAIIVAESIRQLKSIADQKGVQITFEQSESVISGDEMLVRRLVRNLLDNAIKYNLENGRIRIKVQDRTLIIANTGDPIPEDKRELIFERLYRLDPSRSRSSKENRAGAGLGLSIAKWIADVHKAKITVGLSPNGENIFSVFFPR
jgi:heavy metal sensor kinase